ncbi:phage tail tape measure protein [Caenibacillus caldisaponilyticus]|uniref:phage tail tape measure protein n=1 Tax=Caenibacillus caldisaponilyticus TaxID=1674942 RepID=UPI0013010E9C|nr:phage tail tape measure protein [Caenibacillus caldisaponilyticus]
MAEEIENLVARITFDGTQFQKGAAAINRQIKVLQSEFQAAAAKFTDFGKSTDSLKLKSDSLTKQIELQKKRIDALRSSLQQTIEKKGEDSKASQNLAIQINNAKEKLAQMENELKKTNDQLKKQSSGWNQFQQKLGSAGEKMKSIGDKMKDVGESMTKKVTAPIVGVGFAATKAAIDFESAFAGVRKTVNATEDEYRQLEKGIRDMAKQIPSSAEEIAHVAETAGQLGIQKKNILSFTRTMIDLGNSTNLSADEAATALARLANITQMPQNQFRRLGSAIVALGNNMATTESEIAEMALRIAGAGHQVGMTQPQILGFAAALSSVGINAEAGGSAISRVMITMANAVKNGGKALDEFAQVAGMSSSQFAKSFEKDAAGSIIRFIEGLAKVKESGGNVFQVLKDLGLSEIEVRDALLRASGAGDLFRRSLQLSTKAWKDNNALTREATQRYKTTESQLKIFWNRIKDVSISLGQALIPALLDAIDASKPFVDWLKRMAEGFAKLDKPTQRMILAFAGVTAAIGPFLAMVGPLVAGIGALAVAFSAAEISIGAVLGPIGLVIGGITTLGLAIAGLTHRQRDYADEAGHFQKVNFQTADSLMKQHEANEKLIEEFDRLRNKSSLTTEEFGRYLDLQDQLKETSDPEAIKSIKDQMEQLRKKSGLSNDQLQRMVDLNDRLTDKLPEATAKITDQGNKVADTTDKLKEYNEQMGKAATMELERQYENAYSNAKKAVKENKDAHDKLNNSIKLERDLLSLVRNYNKEDVKNELKKHEVAVQNLQILLRSNTLRGEQRKTVVEALEKEKEIVKALKGGKDALLDEVNIIAKENDQLKEQIRNNNKKVKQYEDARRKLEIQYLTEAGISKKIAEQNVKKGTEIDLIDLTIAKLKSKLKTIERETPPNQKNTAEYRRQVSAIKNQISNLESVRSKVIDIKEDAQSLNKALGKSISKKIDMKVDIDWSKIPPQQRRFVIGQVNAWRLQGYAKGTDNAPPGWAWVGEEGPELMWVPGGSKIIPHDLSMKIAKMWQLPQLAVGGDVVRSGLALVGERGRELMKLPAAGTAPLSVGGADIRQIIIRQDQQIAMMQRQVDVLTQILAKDPNFYLDGKLIYSVNKKYEKQETNIRNVFKGVTSL